MDNPAIRPIIDVDGLAKFATWAIYLREDWEYVDKLLTGQLKPNPLERRSTELRLNLYHESIHFIQALATSYLYIHSLELLSIFCRLVDVFQRKNFEMDSLRVLRNQYRLANQKLGLEFHDLSVTQLAEAMAVAESYRAIRGFRDFSFFIDYFWQNQPRYRRVHEIMVAVLEGPYNPSLISPLCFAALNSYQPTRDFWMYLKRLQENVKQITAETLGEDILRIIGFNTESYLKNLRDLVSARPHRFLKEIHEYVFSADPQSWFVSYTVNPSKWLHKWHFDEYAGKIMPYYIICSGGKSRIDGIAVDWPIEKIKEFGTWNAVMGACECLLSDKDPYLACTKSECPVYKSRLCNSMYPPKGPWRECAFHKMLETNFKMDSEKLMQIRDDLIFYD